jgi:hypothetical protein
MWGAWGIHALLPSGRILVSDRNTGFYLFSFDKDMFSKIPSVQDFVVFPNPSSENTICTLSIPITAKDPQITIFDMFGKIIRKEDIINTSIVTLPFTFGSGMYYIQLEYTNYLNEKETQKKKLIIE